MYAVSEHLCVSKMLCSNFTFAVLVIYSSFITTLSAAEYIGNVPAYVQEDDDSLSKETIPAPWTISENDVRYPGSSLEDLIDYIEKFGETAEELPKPLTNDHKWGLDDLEEPNVKRDYGYGSRVRVGMNMANSLVARNSLFGSYGPGRKRSYCDPKTDFVGELEPLVGNSMKQIDEATGFLQNDSSYSNADTQTERMYARNRIYGAQKRSIFTDNGYGSRIGAATNLARGLSATSDLFGIYGPGKKR